MAIGLLGGIGQRAVADAPVIATVRRVAVAVPEKIHALVDDGVGAWPPHQRGDAEGVHETRGDVEVARRRQGAVGTRCHRSPGFIELEIAAERVAATGLEERKQRVGAAEQP